MKGVASALLPLGEEEQSLRSRSAHTCSVTSHLFAATLWTLILVFYLRGASLGWGSSPCIIPPSEQPEQLCGAVTPVKRLNEHIPIPLADGGSNLEQKTLLEAPLPLPTQRAEF